jgi:hypothetical protein
LDTDTYVRSVVGFAAARGYWPIAMSDRVEPLLLGQRVVAILETGCSQSIS